MTDDVSSVRNAAGETRIAADHVLNASRGLSTDAETLGGQYRGSSQVPSVGFFLAINSENPLQFCGNGEQ